MNYEERLKTIINNNNTPFADINIFLKYFPELKKSEDERIRNEIILYIGAKTDISLDTHNKWLSWLEKQSEKKPTDKVEPKFKVGDWLCENEPNNYARFIQILEIINVQGKKRYRISRDIHNDEDVIEFDFVEKYYHRFDIKDANNGDVLNSIRVKATIIFKKWNPDGKHINAYCALQKGILIKQEMLWDRDFEPATKSQRDLLFARMKEARLNITQLKRMIEGNVSSITHKEMVELWERRYQELMSLSKEELVKMIIGSKWNVGITIG